MRTLTHIDLARTEDLFRYKQAGFDLELFPGYTPDQWGIKAHNRPWISEKGRFVSGQKIMEVGGAYSLLPQYLTDHYGVEAWIGDDFGIAKNEPQWARWGDPGEWAVKHPNVHYVFKPFGVRSAEYPDQHFDRILTVSTLEHIAVPDIPAVLSDIHRCLKPGGMELHTIDIPIHPRAVVREFLREECSLLRPFMKPLPGGIRFWTEMFRQSGVKLGAKPPSSLTLLDRSILVESPDVVYRFYPPNNAPKAYRPSASLLLVIEDV